jgi:Zn finger protein HypA/HybF involved in hydrogenase expression
MAVVALNRSLEQELFALTRGASLECLACGEFVLHVGVAVECPECGSRLEGGVAVAEGLAPPTRIDRAIG